MKYPRAHLLPSYGSRTGEYGEPITLLLVAAGAALTAGGTYVAGKSREEKETQEAQEKKERQRLQREGQSAELRTEGAQSEAASILQAADVRRASADAQIAHERQTTQYVDVYRQQAGLVGDEYDRVLDNLYDQERNTIETEYAEMVTTTKEKKESEQPSTPWLAWAAGLGAIAVIGSIVYKRRTS